MTLSKTISTAEGRISEAVESGRSRLKAVVDSAEEGVEATLPRLREQLVVLRERSFEDAQRYGGYVTEVLTWVGSSMPKVKLPFSDQVPSPEEVSTAWFDTAGRALETQRKLVTEWLAALRQEQTGAPKTKATRSTKESRTAA